MILVDSDVLMHAAGGPHRRKIPSATWLEKVARGEVEAAVDTGILQEILQRQGKEVYDLARKVVPLVLLVDTRVLDRAGGLLERDGRLSVRDAVRAAVVLEHGLEGICSYDRAFDRIKGVKRVDPTATSRRR